MTTARDIIKAALLNIQVLGKGVELSNDEAQDALVVLNGILATWSAEGNLIFTESRETFNLTSSASYTIGSGGDFDTERPNYISAAYVTQGTTDFTLKEIDNQQYASILQKDISSIPDCFYYDGGFPLATIFLYPKPTASAITLYTFKPLTKFTTLDTVFSMPEEYKSALIYTLSVWIAPQYEREASMTIKQLAHTTKNAVEAQNKRNEDFIISISDIPSNQRRGRYIYEDYYN